MRTTPCGGLPVPSVLVVDDDPSVLACLRDVLEVEGYEVRVAGDGDGALRSVAQQRPDCVLLDVMMPGLDGHAVLAQLRAAEGGAGLPVIMLTAAADDATAWQAWSGGVDYFLAKPFDPSELLRYLDQLFAVARQPAAP